MQVCGLCGIRFAMVMDGGDGMFYSLVIVGIGVEVELGVLHTYCVNLWK